jgi:hypothetical protein
MKNIFLLILCFVGFLLLIAGLDYSGLMWQSFIGPKRQNIRRQIFEQTKSYNEGKTQDLIRYRMEYLQAKTSEEKEVIASTIRHMLADYDEYKLPVELRQFLTKIKYGEYQ